MAGVTVNVQKDDMVYNMETGEMVPKKKDMEAIAEEAE